MKKVLFFTLLCVIVLLCVPCLAGEVVELPVEDGTVFPPRPEYLIFEEGEKSPIGYEDPSISVRLERGRFLESDWLAVRVKVAGPGQIRTAMSSKFGQDVTVVGTVMARKANAVFAINADYCSARNGGYLVRQGRQYRLDCQGGHDVLVIDSRGDFHVFDHATNEDIKSFTGTVYNSFTFGPCLVLDGKKRTDEDYAYFDVGMYKQTQRMAICQTGPLEYLCVCCNGPENPGSTGLTMDEFADLLMTFDGIRIAYNLDGGSSSTAVFLTSDMKYQKVNAKGSKVRDIKDIIYFASAWDPTAESFLVEDDD